MKSALAPLSAIWRDNVGFDRVLFLFYGLAWQIKRRMGVSFVTKLANGARVKVHPVTSFSAIFYCRWQERKDVLFIRTHADLARIFVDVGANTGVLSAQLFDKFSAFYLFEPALSSYSALRENCALNPHVDCKTFNIAVADFRGEATFLDEGNYSSLSRIVPDARKSAANVRTVPVATLDEMLGNVVDDMILKVDVEGAEERVFIGASSLFRAQRFKLVMFERLELTNLRNVKEFFANYGYVLFYVTDEGLPSRDEVHIKRPLINLFACPSSVWKLINRQH